MHVDVAVTLERNPFSLQQPPMLTPPRSRPPILIHHPMTRQQFGPRGIPKRPPYHSGMARPPRQGRHITICRDLAARNLTHDAQHLPLKHPSLLHRHSIREIFHLVQCNWAIGAIGVRPLLRVQKGSDPNCIILTLEQQHSWYPPSQ